MQQKIIRTILIDDEEPARIILREYLSAFPDIEITAECSNGFDAVKTIGELDPDLIFLDIQMPKLNGFEVLELIEQQPAVIFATAYDQYALRAFEVHAADYLLKPFSAERLAEALDRVRERIKKHDKLPLQPIIAAARINAIPLERACYSCGSHRLYRSPGRLYFHQNGRKILPQAAAYGRNGKSSRSDKICQSAPVLYT